MKPKRLPFFPYSGQNTASETPYCRERPRRRKSSCRKVRQEITIHRAAKQAFDELQITKLPSNQSLYEEFHRLAVQKKQDCAEYRQVRKEREELLIAKQTVETILNILLLMNCL